MCNHVAYNRIYKLCFFTFIFAVFYGIPVYAEIWCLKHLMIITAVYISQNSRNTRYIVSLDYW